MSRDYAPVFSARFNSRNPEDDRLLQLLLKHQRQYERMNGGQSSGWFKSVLAMLLDFYAIYGDGQEFEMIPPGDRMLAMLLENVSEVRGLVYEMRSGGHFVTGTAAEAGQPGSVHFDEELTNIILADMLDDFE